MPAYVDRNGRNAGLSQGAGDCVHSVRHCGGAMSENGDLVAAAVLGGVKAKSKPGSVTRLKPAVVGQSSLINRPRAFVNQGKRLKGAERRREHKREENRRDADNGEEPNKRMLDNRDEHGGLLKIARESPS